MKKIFFIGIMFLSCNFREKSARICLAGCYILGDSITLALNDNIVFDKTFMSDENKKRYYFSLDSKMKQNKIYYKDNNNDTVFFISTDTIKDDTIYIGHTPFKDFKLVYVSKDENLFKCLYD